MGLSVVPKKEQEIFKNETRAAKEAGPGGTLFHRLQSDSDVWVKIRDKLR